MGLSARPACGHTGNPWRSARGPLCVNCRRRASVTAGTIFQGTRKPLKLWFITAWEIVGHKYGANALNVKRMLGVNSYKTAWSWLHKLRRAMVRPDRDRLLGVVEQTAFHAQTDDPARAPLHDLLHVVVGQRRRRHELGPSSPST